MKLIYFISQSKVTAGMIDADNKTPLCVLNETLRPHLPHPEDQEGDLVHANLEEAKLLAVDIVFDLGDKSIDVLAISVEDDVFAGFKASGDITDSARTDPHGGRLLKLSQHACQVINADCIIMPIRFVVPMGIPSGWADIVH